MLYRRPPDLILLDINMARMNGSEVYRRLKAGAALRDIPEIFITALNETADEVKVFSMGAVDFITEPFRTEEVYARIETHLRPCTGCKTSQNTGEMKQIRKPLFDQYFDTCG